MLGVSPSFENTRVSVAMLLREPCAHARSAFVGGLRSALEQDLPPVEVIVVDGRGPAAAVDFVPDDVDRSRVRHVPGTYANRAAMFNAAIEAANGELLLLIFNDEAAVTLRRSALRVMVMAATRGFGVQGSGFGDSRTPDRSADRSLPIGMVYADYERIESGGARREVHLLDWHEGRLRDTVDFGRAILFPTAALKEVGGLDESYGAADGYDLRLRVSERYRPVHVANRFAGSLYAVAAPPAAHNVFDYLLAGKQAQLELERALTAHLKRTAAYLAPGDHVRAVECSERARAGTHDCVASIVTPVNHRPAFIGRAIESVQAQTVQQVEMIVVVNGGPQDPTADQVRRYMEGGDKYDARRPPVRLIVLDVNNIGLCLNTGIAAARGRYYVQLDSDDRLKPDAVAKLVAVFDSDPTIGMVIGSYEVWTLDEQSGALRRNEEIPVVTHAEWTPENGRNNLLRINGAGAPRAAPINVIKELGWFGVNDSPHCRNYGEDYDLVLRISERYTIGRVWQPIYEVLRHSGGTDHAIDAATIDRNDNAKDEMRREALRRRWALNCRREE